MIVVPRTIYLLASRIGIARLRWPFLLRVAALILLFIAFLLSSSLERFLCFVTFRQWSFARARTGTLILSAPVSSTAKALTLDCCAGCETTLVFGIAWDDAPVARLAIVDEQMLSFCQDV